MKTNEWHGIKWATTAVNGTKKQAAVRNPLTAMSRARGRGDSRTLYAAAEAEAERSDANDDRAECK